MRGQAQAHPAQDLCRRCGSAQLAVLHLNLGNRVLATLGTEIN